MKPDKDFRDKVYSLVAQIPSGRMMTYGQISLLCGHPRAARIVGGIAHRGDPSLPWQRVVKHDGRLAEGFPGGIEGHRQVLEAEGILTGPNLKVDVKHLQWWPPN